MTDLDSVTFASSDGRAGISASAAVSDSDRKASSQPRALPFSGRGVIGKRADVAAVLVAGGSGDRFGRRGGKQTISVCGYPLLSWSIEAFDAAPQIAKIVIAAPAQRIDEYRRIAVDPFDFVTPIQFVPSGYLRQESARCGVEVAAREFAFCAMHDGARPLVRSRVITHIISVLKGTLDADGAVYGHPAIDTLKVVDADCVVGTPDRSLFWVVQTPQVFHSDILLEAHHTALEEGFVGTDDASLVERIGGKVVLVESPRDNIKLTVPEDLAPIEAMLRYRMSMSEQEASA